jgi:hypothetical protein
LAPIKALIDFALCFMFKIHYIAIILQVLKYFIGENVHFMLAAVSGSLFFFCPEVSSHFCLSN